MRDVTVGELRELLAEYPDHWPVEVGVDKTIGVLTDVWVEQTPDRNLRDSTPRVVLGERP